MEKAWLEPRYSQLYAEISQNISNSIQSSEKFSMVKKAKGDQP